MMGQGWRVEAWGGFRAEGRFALPLGWGIFQVVRKLALRAQTVLTFFLKNPPACGPRPSHPPQASTRFVARILHSKQRFYCMEMLAAEPLWVGVFGMCFHPMSRKLRILR